ncbi:DUF2285 domain-containing protein [Bradyrhizobium sp. STM 3562]|uniref:DUF2285 domain-containing protein n=1 Tax=Bradyrhizobium sp. STM 3562 TaxID=578924 RepID=UPI00388DA66D
MTCFDPADYGGGDWAWEFLRLNQDYVADWRRSVPRHQPCIRLSDGTQLLRLRRRFPHAEKWGLYSFADPRLCPHKAPVFWYTSAFKRVVRLAARAPKQSGAARTLADFDVQRRAVIGVDGHPLVLVKGRGLQIPIVIGGLSVLTAPFAPVFELHGLADLPGQTELLRDLQRFTGEHPTTTQRPRFTNDERLRLRHALIALQASLNGKTYRQIAINIFGEKKVAEEWQGPSQYLKDRTRRLVTKGTELMKGGYRELLD